MRRILSILLENETGALSRVAGLFSQRGYNIESITAAPTDDPSLFRLTIQTKGDARVLEQIEKQLNKLVDVFRVTELTSATHIEREVMLVKLQASGYGRDEVKRSTDIFRGQIVDVTATLYTVQLTGTSEKLDAFLDAVRGFAEIVEIARSGIVGMSRGDKMEFTIQKSIELGVSLITPLFSERCGVKLDAERLNKKIQQWQKIAIAACEQCGRNQVPEIRPAMDVEAWCAEQDDALKINLHPRASASINTLPLPVERVRLLIGPEGGLSADEIAMTARYQFTDILLGPRVLRTETTALTAITALQVRFGDLG